MPGSFVHLHNHTEYSLLDGAVHIKDLIAECSRMGMPAVAITDHGNLFGAIELVMEANSLNKSVAAWNKEHPEGPQKQEVKPIFGCEVYLSPTPIGVKKQLPGRRKYTHLLLLAENETGWQNLVKLVSRSHLEGFYYKPRVDMETLREFHEGLICCTACLAGPLNEWLLNDQPEMAEEALLALKDIFGDDNIFVELQDHGMEEQKKCLPELVRIARKTNTPILATNDVHFLRKEDHDMHDVLICIGTNEKLASPKRMRYSTEVCGNFWRGAKASVRGMDRATADYVGMLATVMNALALQSALERAGVPCVVQSAIEMKNVAESFIRLKARTYLDNNKIVIFAAGTGNPFFSTDTTAALRASEINAEVVMKATSVDGVYDADPKKVSDAKRFDAISYQECLERQLKVMDSTAFTLCMDNKKPIIVFDMHTPGNITRALLGEPIGTTIS